ncbi:MAG: iron-containing alcohol dehydrogenase PsrA [Pseudomonadota bacterium]
MDGDIRQRSETFEMWTFHNPVRICFGEGSLRQLAQALDQRRYLLVTYGEPYFAALVDRISNQAGPPVAVVDEIKPNPDFSHFKQLCGQLADLASQVEVIVALGGGSVIDAAKVLSASLNDFALVEDFLLTGRGEERFDFHPIIAIPTTAGTGSEVTSWATVWDSQSSKKYSLSHPRLLPELALVDPELMADLPMQLTISTGLDALSHSLESIWNKNANPLSTDLAVAAARGVLSTLPRLTEEPGSLALRNRMAKAALTAGMAFSNTKTALAHSLSYPITLEHGLPHGLACSFSLPMIMAGVIGQDAETDEALRRIFGEDLDQAVLDLAAFLEKLGVPISPAKHGIPREDFRALIASAFQGERGRNFIGREDRVLAAEARLTG